MAITIRGLDRDDRWCLRIKRVINTVPAFATEDDGLFVHQAKAVVLARFEPALHMIV